jgi:endonuclease/exonuclease/phosphatase family metal-dependent hydrolase
MRGPQVASSRVGDTVLKNQLYRCVRIGLLVWAAISPLVVRADDQLKLATLNCEFLVRRTVHVKFGLELDRKEWTDEQRKTWEQPGYRDARFREATKAVAEFIKRIDADVIGLCEVGSEADVADLYRELAALGLNYAHRAVCDSTDTFTGQHVAVLSKRKLDHVDKVIPGRERYDRELDNDVDGEDDTGISKGMHVTFEAAGQPVHFYVAHLASERGGHERDAQRIAQASIIRRHYLPHLNAGAFVVVAGDLNDHPNEPAIRRIRGRDDIWPDLANTGAVKYFPKDKLDTRWTYEFLGVREQLDYILISESLESAARSQGVRASTLPVTEKVVGTEIPATDHRAFIVTLDLK